MQQLMQSRLLKLNFAPLKMRCLMWRFILGA
jgi:hypothetical protein